MLSEGTSIIIMSEIIIIIKIIIMREPPKFEMAIPWQLQSKVFAESRGYSYFIIYEYRANFTWSESSLLDSGQLSQKLLEDLEYVCYCVW